jgi:KaiC/GvpD/RAD55 family RecA-like ATPase
VIRGDDKAETGISGLDEILSGGFSRGHIFPLEGDPGAGKTTLAIEFLVEGAKRGERRLYVTLSQTERELRQAAAAHGWSSGICNEGPALGEPLGAYRGVLHGEPNCAGDKEPLLGVKEQ